MRKHPMSHILVDSESGSVHHFLLPYRLETHFSLLRGSMSTCAIRIFLVLICFVGSLAAQQNEQTSRASLAPGLKSVSFAWADAVGVHLGSPQWADDWVRKNAKNFPTIRFSQTPVAGAENYLIVISDSTSVLNGFQLVARVNSTTSVTDFSGSGNARDNSGSGWTYTFDGTATSTTTTMTHENVPYTIESHALYASVYGGPGALLISRHSETVGSQQGGDPSNAAIYNLGQMARRIRLKTRLLNSVARDIVKFPTVEVTAEHSTNKTEVAAPLQTPTHPETSGTTASEALCTVSVTSNPGGAEIYVDDSFIGRAPVTIDLKPGKHSIRAFAKDYQNWSRWITITAGSQ